jgi:iron complex outermembrane receptor protein
MNHFRAGSSHRLLFFSLSLALAAGSAVAEDRENLADLSLEQLMQREVVWASKIAQQISDSPSAVAIVTAADIRAYGYRTLADVINSMRGLYTTSDRRYQYMGGRGFGAPEDYAGRIMLLIDGYATQDNLFTQAYIEDSGLLDLEIIERVEYVPGTGSVTYGNNALLGIINVVTKNGRDFNTAQLSTEFASHGMQKQRVTMGKLFDNGADLLLSASVLKADGQNHYFPAYDSPTTNNGWAENIDNERNKRLFGKFSFEGWTLEAAYVDRKKVVPTNPDRFTLFNTPYAIDDTNAFVNLRYEADLGLKLRSASRFYYGYYGYEGSREYADYSEDNIRYGERHHEGRWWGLEQKFVGNWFTDHAVVFGFEFRNDFTQHLSRAYFSPTYSFLSERNKDYSRTITSFYLTDEYRINDQWSINVGARYDNASDLKSNISPRVAAIYRPSLSTTLKASYSEAFRMPNANELSSTPAESVAPEYVTATELVLQHDFSPRMRLTSSIYRYIRSDQLVYDLAQSEYLPTGSSHADGVEFELERSWESGIRTRGSLAFQHSEDTDGQDAVNSPNALGKFNLTFPIIADRLRLGFEAQYIGRRLSLERRELSSVTLANLTLSSERKWYGMSASFSLRNLFDKEYEVVSPSGVLPDSLRMDGRTSWLQLNYDL